MKQLTQRYSVSPQINVEDLANIKEQGFTAIINNRPDGEEIGQPLSSDIGSAAQALGLDYVHIPMNGPQVSEDQVELFKAFVEKNSGKIFAFCRSGNRSSIIYNVANG